MRKIIQVQEQEGEKMEKIFKDNKRHVITIAKEEFEELISDFQYPLMVNYEPTISFTKISKESPRF